MFSLLLTNTRLNARRLKYLSLLGLSGLLVLTSACTTDRLITRKNHDSDRDYCWQRITDTQAGTELLNTKLNHEILNYQELIEEVLTERKRALTLTQLISKDAQDDPISPHMLDELNKAMTRGLALSDKIVSVVARNECWLQADKKDLAEHRLPPLDEYTRYKGFLLAFSATLTLYDSYYTTAAILNEDDKIRQFLNQADRGYAKQKGQLRAVTETIFNLANVRLVQEEIRFFEKTRSDYASRLLEHAPDYDAETSYLNTLIKQSPAYPILRKATTEYVRDQQEIHSSAEVEDKLRTLNRSTLNGISKFFGNTVGLIEERKGKLFQDKPSHNYLMHRLKAGDILLEKTPFRLTDKMIPGHWGHAAIWVGTQSELKELGIWDHPIVKPYQNKITNSQSVAEALRSGVELNSLAHFMNIDDVAIIRDPSTSKNQTAARIIRSLRQIGKQYDFNYNVETTDKIVCSQLVYLAYTDIMWPTDKLLGRHTISPDNIAIKATQHGPLELIVFYHDGKLIEDEPVSLLERLMGKK